MAARATKRAGKPTPNGKLSSRPPRRASSTVGSAAAIAAIAAANSTAQEPAANSRRRDQVRRLQQRVRALSRAAAAARRVLHTLEDQQEEIRAQNQQLIESQRLLELSRDRYVSLYEYAPIGYVTFTSHGVIREINRLGAAMLGLAAGRVVDTPLLLFVAPASRRALLNHLRRCRIAFERAAGAAGAAGAADAAGDPLIATELIIQRRGGRGELPIQLLTGLPTAGEGGMRYRSAMFDLSERVEAERQRQRLRATEASERLFREVLGALPVAVRVLDPRGGIIMSNGVSRRIWGDLAWPADDAPRIVRRADTGANLSYEQTPAFRALCGQVVLNELLVLGPPDSPQYLRESAVPLFGNGGHDVEGAVAVTEDVTTRTLADQEIRRARDAAEQANRHKDEFLATLSHELRTPVGAILLWTHLLRTARASAEDPAEAIAVIEHSARAQARLIDDLLDVSRLAAGKISISPTPQPLEPLLKPALEAVRLAADAKQIHLESDLAAASHAFANVDADRFRQILLNLLNNAIKFTPHGGTVRLRTEAHGATLSLSVTDTGIGIAPEFLPHVFDRFRQADASLTRQHGGLGLGLAIARQLAEMHGAHLDVESPGLGRGATFRLELPLMDFSGTSRSTLALPPAAAAAPAARAAAAAPGPDDHNGDEQHEEAPLHGLRVIVVDDDQRALIGMSRIIENAGAHVSRASSAASALRLFKRALSHHVHVDVIVSDISMPEQDGYDLIRKIRQREANGGGAAADRGGVEAEPPVPAIALTAHARPEDRSKALEAGFQAHLAKPIEPEHLIGVLASLAGR